MFLRCIFAHVYGRDYSLELIMLVSCFHKQSLVEKKNSLDSLKSLQMPQYFYTMLHNFCPDLLFIHPTAKRDGDHLN